MPYQPLTYLYQPGVPGRPLLLLLHGTGGDERDLLPVAARLSPGSAVLSVRGNVSEHGMPRFFRRLGMGVFDEADVAFRTHELAHFLRELSNAEGFDLRQVVAVGYSNGANIAGSLLLLYPDLLGGAVLWRPMQPLTKEVPVNPAQAPTPVLFVPGAQDPTVDRAASDHYAALLASRGFDLTPQTVAAGHNLTQTDLDLATAWLQKHFPTVAAPPAR